MPGTFEYNATNGVAPTATNSFIDGAFTLGGVSQPTAVAATQGLSATQIKDGLTGVQSYIGFDLSKYDEGSRVVPANAGYRVGCLPSF